MSSSITENIFTTLKIICGLCTQTLQPLIFLILIFLSLPKYLIVATIQYAAFSDWPLLLHNMHLGPSMSFHGLIYFYQWIIGHFLDSVLIYSPQWRAVQLLLSFVNLNKAPIKSMLMYFVDISFQFTWVNIKEHDRWIIRRLRVCSQFFKKLSNFLLIVHSIFHFYQRVIVLVLHILASIWCC